MGEEGGGAAASHSSLGGAGRPLARGEVEEGRPMTRGEAEDGWPLTGG